METEKLKKRFEFLTTKEGLKQNWTWFAVPMVFLLALYLRYLPAQGMEYLQALDPYWIFRQSQHLALEGNIPTVDFMRYFPYNAPFYNFNVGDIVFPALFYWLGPFMIFGNYMQWAQFYPALMGALGVLATYFLGKELFNRVTGVSAAFFLATIPGVLHRTSAGFFEKEPLGTFFMLVSLYFFTRAWKRNQQWAGVLSGIALGFFTISWGGSKMLWLLYPLVIGLMLWINEDIEELVAAFTPTVLIGGLIASALNPSRFWVAEKYFLVNIGMLLLLWSRYSVEEFELVKEKYIPYYTPTMSILGLLGLILSPLYSDFIAKNFIGIINSATQSSGGVIGGTVAENQAASISQLAGQLGAISSRNIGNVIGGQPGSVIGTIFSLISNINGAWPLAFIGVVLLGTKTSAMLLRKFDLIEEEVLEKDYYKLLLSVTVAWLFIFSISFNSSIILAVAPAILCIVGGIGILYGLEEFKNVEIEIEWYHILPLAWIITNVLSAVNTSRLIFLAAFPVAFMAGYTFSKVITRLNNLEESSTGYLAGAGSIILIDLVIVYLLTPLTGLPLAASILMATNVVAYLYLPEEWYSEDILGRKELKIGLIGLVLALTIVTNISAGYVSGNSLGGSPNQLWMDNLEYMSNETEEGAVILSWWDYGYWFESIGERAAIADGGNNGYYTSGEKVNMPLADFLTSENPENHTDFLEKHSVDYIVLDETMIGKYSAVSQISNRNNQEFNSMMQLSTSRDIRRNLDQNQSLLTARRGRGLTVYAPIQQSLEGVDISTNASRKPSLEVQSRRGTVRNDISCVINEDGITEFENVSRPASIPNMGEVCLAENPYNSIENSILSAQNQNIRPRQAKMVLVPKEIANSTLVRLYIMDGHNIDFVEKVQEGSNGFVKMWKVKNSEEE